MCHGCHSSHQNFKALKDHQVVLIAELNKGKVFSKKTKETDKNYCKKHKEKKKFYCKTCQKTICRDCIVMAHGCSNHKFVTLNEMYETQVNYIKQEMNKFSMRKNKFQNIIKETEEIEKHLDRNVEEAKKAIAKLRQDSLDIVEEKVKSLTQGVNSEHSMKKQELSVIKWSLLDTVAKFERVHNTVSQLVENASEYDFTDASMVPSLLSKLKELEKHNPEPTNTKLSYIPKPVLPFVFIECKTWQKLREIKVPFAPVGVTCGTDNEIGVIGYSKACIVTKSGKVMATFKLEHEFAQDIAFSKGNRYLISGQEVCKCCKYDNNGNLISFMHPLDKEGNPSISYAVHVDSDGCILLGGNETISKYRPDESFISKFDTDSIPRGITVTQNGRIAVIFHNHKMMFVGYSRKTIKVLEPPSDWDVWEPVSICTSKQGDIFVLNTGNPKSVNRYSADGDYLDCIILRLHDPRSITMSPDGQELLVADYTDDSIVIYQRPANLD